MFFRLNNRKRYCEDYVYALILVDNYLLQNVLTRDVTIRLACAHKLTTLAHQIYLLTAEINTIAQLKQTNAAAGMDSTKNALSSPRTHVWSVLCLCSLSPVLSLTYIN